MILICLDTSSSYPIDTPVSRGRTRILFFGRNLPCQIAVAIRLPPILRAGANLLLGNKKSLRPQTGGSTYLSVGGSIMVSAVVHAPADARDGELVREDQVLDRLFRTPKRDGGVF